MRNTPASAGKTPESHARQWLPAGAPPRRRGGRASLRSRCLPRRNNPRVGGEDVYPGMMPPDANGTPPRRRGRPVPDLAFGTCRRSPPRRRGRCQSTGEQLIVRRNTPASAGMTGLMVVRHRRPTEQRRFDDVEAPNLRSTPASAGRPSTRRRCRSGPAEHSRVGGEDRPVPFTYLSTCGTPRVGWEDVSVATVGSHSTGTPPRRQGGQAHHQGGPPRGRNTPASAGRTQSRGPPGTRWSEHPRIGREDSLAKVEDQHACGTPPRRRGGPGGSCGGGGFSVRGVGGIRW